MSEDYSQATIKGLELYLQKKVAKEFHWFQANPETLSQVRVFCQEELAEFYRATGTIELVNGSVDVSFDELHGLVIELSPSFKEQVESIPEACSFAVYISFLYFIIERPCV